MLSKVALTEAEQGELATKRSLIQTHSSHASGLGDGVNTQSKVPDEQLHKKIGTDEGAGDKLEVPDVPTYKSDSEEESWIFSNGDDDDDDVDKESDVNDDNEENESDDDGNDFVHQNLSTYTTDDQDKEENAEEEKAKNDEDLSDQRVYTPPYYQLSEESEKQKGDDKVEEGEEEKQEEDLIYEDLNLNLERSDAEMTEAHATKDMEDAHVNLTTVTLVVQQQSSSMSDLVLMYINPSPDAGIDSNLNQDIQYDTLVDIPVIAATETPSSDTTTLQLSIPNIHSLQQTPDPTITTTIPITTLLEIPNFASLFTISLIPGIVDAYLASKMKETVNVAIQLKSDKLREEAQAKNQDFLNSLDSNMNKIIKEQVKAQTSKIMSKVE
ncbi:hypothetical protein Tco_0997480 [Tanacetum coccineum]